MPKGSGNDLVIPFEASPQITRAIVGKKEIRFEIQVPDEVGVTEFVKKLEMSFKHEFRVNEFGYYGDDPSPVTVAPHARDRSKVVATYSLEGWTPKKNLSDDGFRTKQALKETGVRMGHYDIERGEMDERVEHAIHDAFAALEGLSKGEPRSHVAQQAYRQRLKRETQRSR